MEGDGGECESGVLRREATSLPKKQQEVNLGLSRYESTSNTDTARRGDAGKLDEQNPRVSLSLPPRVLLERPLCLRQFAASLDSRRGGCYFLPVAVRKTIPMRAKRFSRSLCRGGAALSSESIGGFGRFATTRWSLVLRVSNGDPEVARQALSELLATYLPALRAHLVMGLRFSEDRAEDLLQSFTADKILEQGLLRLADPTRGRFRSLLLKALQNYVFSVARHDKAQKRSPADRRLVDIDSQPEPADRSHALPDIYDVTWGREVLARTVKNMRAECEQSGRDEVWDIFQCRVLAPILGSAEPVPYQTLVERHGLTSPIQASNLLLTGKRMFARILRGVVAEYSSSEEEVEAELRDLKDIFARAEAGRPS